MNPGLAIRMGRPSSCCACMSASCWTCYSVRMSSSSKQWQPVLHPPTHCTMSKASHVQAHTSPTSAAPPAAAKGSPTDSVQGFRGSILHYTRMQQPPEAVQKPPEALQKQPEAAQESTRGSGRQAPQVSVDSATTQSAAPPSPSAASSAEPQAPLRARQRHDSKVPLREYRALPFVMCRVPSIEQASGCQAPACFCDRDLLNAGVPQDEGILPMQ